MNKEIYNGITNEKVVGTFYKVEFLNKTNGELALCAKADRVAQTLTTAFPSIESANEFAKELSSNGGDYLVSECV